MITTLDMSRLPPPLLRTTQGGMAKNVLTAGRAVWPLSLEKLAFDIKCQSCLPTWASPFK